MIIAANWKMNKSPNEVRQYFSNFKNIFNEKIQIQSNGSTRLSHLKIVFFPSTICLEATAHSLQDPSMANFTNLQYGSQNCFYETKGAFTGETSAETAKEIGAQWILIGHSERRILFGETDKAIAKKVALTQSLDLIPLLCVGETLEERQGLETAVVLEMQIRRGLAMVDRQKEVVIAYEPVWAIGTGKVATLDQIEEAHTHINFVLAKMGLIEIPILYGGSVNEQNATEIKNIPFVGGFLVGGASLAPESFLKIIMA